MRTHRSFALMAALALLICGGAACSKDTPLTTPTGPSQTAQAIVVTGSTSLRSLGEIRQLGVTATFTDGTTRDVTDEANCREVPYADSPAPYVVVRASDACLMTAVAFGLQEVEVAYPATQGWPPPSGSAYTRVTVAVVPDGAHVLYGRVAQWGVPLQGTRVILTAESGAREAITDRAGRYMFAPVAGDVTVRADLEGYVGQERRIGITRDERLDFDLRQEEEPAGIAGVYRLTLTASDTCTLPAEARERTYMAMVTEAVVTGAGSAAAGPAATRTPVVPWWGTPYVEVVAKLSGAVFASSDSTIYGIRESNAVTFTLPATVQPFGLGEFIQSKEVRFVGQIDATISLKRLEGPLTGTILVIDRATGATIAQCASGTHKAVFAR